MIHNSYQGSFKSLVIFKYKRMKKNEKKGGLYLPVQVLNWSSFRDDKKLWKIFLQFELIEGPRGRISFELVAYPAYNSGKSCSWGTKKRLPVVKGSPMHRLNLPITLGNLELGIKEIQKFRDSPGKRLVFTPRLYKANPHAAYDVSDESGSVTMLANPTPPGRPSA
jgi:hypothetical protein